MSAERNRGLRKRTKPFTQVPNELVDDWTLSYRELGVLTRILRMPEGYDIRSQQLADEGKGRTLRGREANREGREAVRTALRGLARGGYYRLGRCRMLDGTFEMVTDVSEDADPIWAEQAAIFDGKAVPMFEQPDGSFLVRYPDGTMHPDGFPPPAGNPEEINNPGAQKPVPGASPGPRNPGPGEAGTGKAGPGSCDAFNKMVKEDGYQDSVPASQVRPGQADAKPIQGTIDGKDEAPSAQEPKPQDIAFGIANGWIKYRADQGTPIAGNRIQHRLKSLVLPFLEAGYSENEIKRALADLDSGIPSSGALQRALDGVRTRRSAGRQNAGTSPMAGTNRHLDDVSAEERRARNPLAAAVSSSQTMSQGGAAA